MTDDAAAIAAAAAAAAAAQKPWYDGKADADTVGHWQNKAWDIKDPAVIAIEATKAHREAERLIGAPPSQIIRLPADMVKDADGMKAVWQRLGAPADAKDYTFDALKGADGKITDTATEAALRDTFGKTYVPKPMADAITATVVKIAADKAAAADVEKQAALKTEHEALAKNWGANAPANKVIAQNAAAALKMTPADVQALENVVGYARVMEMLRDVGTKIGEAKFITPGGNNGNNGIATREQAQNRINELKKDGAWTKRYMDGDTAAVREMTDLTKLVVGDDIEGRF